MYQCTKCRKTFLERAGKCKNCNAWNSMEQVDVTPGPNIEGDDDEARAIPITAINIKRERRISTGLAELDRVLGGDETATGAVLPSVVLLSGDPGIGKSTLVLQAAGRMARDSRVLYATGEESRSNVTARADRLGAKHEQLFLMADHQLGRVEEEAKKVEPRVIIIDSVQTMLVPDLDAQAGSVSQVKAVGDYLPKMARKFDATIFLIGHVTKDGGVAGPKTLEHLVDATLHFEGEQGRILRTLRTHKNRFGSTMEVGVFEMTPNGLMDIESPSAHFLAQRVLGAPGSIVTAMCGTNSRRSMLVEIQTLVGADTPRQQLVVTGMDKTRVETMLAVLERRAKVAIGSKQIIVNVAGGIAIDEAASDLALTIAIASEIEQRPVHQDLVVFGEVGLSGELRDTTQAVLRLKEAAACGFKRALVPPFKGLERVENIEIVRAGTLREAIDIALAEAA